MRIANAKLLLIIVSDARISNTYWHHVLETYRSFKENPLQWIESVTLSTSLLDYITTGFECLCAGSLNCRLLFVPSALNGTAQREAHNEARMCASCIIIMQLFYLMKFL
jgi:hypothetical protein